MSFFLGFSSAFAIIQSPPKWHAPFDEQQRLMGLRRCTVQAGGVDDSFGKVEFVVHFKVDGKGHCLYEISRFKEVEGRRPEFLARKHKVLD